MQELSSLVNFERLPPGYSAASVVTIGNFDGCHLGHQSLVAAAKSFAHLDTLALTFSPRPEAFFKGSSDQGGLLFSPLLKKIAFRELGVDALLIQKFDAAFSQLTPERFYTLMLKRHLNAQAVVVGENFCFGHKRQGTAAWLRERGQADDTAIITLPALSVDGTPISSTRIRAALRSGKVEEASKLLGRPYLLYGGIVRGDQLGRQLGVPTANLAAIDQLIPADGVYAGHVWLGEACHSAVPPVLSLDKAALIPAVFSIGKRPSVNAQGGELRVEAHLLTGRYGANELYGLPAGFYVSHFLRPDARFASLDELSLQMQHDITKARSLVCP